MVSPTPNLVFRHLLLLFLVPDSTLGIRNTDAVCDQDALGEAGTMCEVCWERK